MNKTLKTILDIPIENQSREIILDKIKKYIKEDSGTATEFFHIVSLNPEIMVATAENVEFKEVVQSAQIRIKDGSGIGVAGALLGVDTGERFTGVELTEELLKYASSLERPIVLIGGGDDLAEDLVVCYSQKFPSGTYLGVQGIKNIKKPTKEEEQKLFSIVADRTPQIILAAFGSPDTELWFYRNREKLKGVVCASVGGSFNYLSGRVSRPPEVVRKLGMEWLWRLITEPWRWKRQLRLIKFGYLVCREKMLKS